MSLTSVEKYRHAIAIKTILVNMFENQSEIILIINYTHEFEFIYRNFLMIHSRKK